MQEPIYLLEHKEYSNRNHSDNKIQDIVGLETYLKKNKWSSYLHTTADGIKATSWVGVVKYKNQQIHILPKLIKSDEQFKDNKKQIIQNLIFMLSYTRKLDIKTNSSANISKCQNPFLEILIREYCNSLFEALKRLSPKNYIREEDNLNFLRGKLKFNENIKYNCANQARFYCEYDEFSENNLLNQLFLFVSTCLYKLTNDSKNKTVLKQIMDYFSELKIVKFDKFNIKKIKLTRNQSLFNKPFELAKMFVEHSSIDISSNRFENITLLWDMNKLFEEFVFEILRRNQDDNFKVTAQKGRRLLREVELSKTKRDTKIDIMVNEKTENPIVVDTKYKEFHGLAQVSSSDIYQVTTYCTLHDSKKAFLVYPLYSTDKSYKYTLNTVDKDKSIGLNFITVDITQPLEKTKVKELAKQLKAKIK